MANASSRAHAVHRQNTAVLYCEPSETDGTPVSTARIVPVGASNAARSGATLQLVGGMVEPQVIEVEPPRAAPRKPQKRATRVIAYNVHIVAEGEERVEPGYVEQDVTPSPEQVRGHREMEFELPGRKGEQGFPQNAQFHREPPHVQMRSHRMPHMPHMPNPAAFDMPPRAQPAMRMPHGANAGSIPMSLFGALENMGGMLHEQTRGAAAASYKQLLAQHLNAGRGPLLSNRNLCIAVGAYALLLFLLAVFGG